MFQILLKISEPPPGVMYDPKRACRRPNAAISLNVGGGIFTRLWSHQLYGQNIRPHLQSFAHYVVLAYRTYFSPKTGYELISNYRPQSIIKGAIFQGNLLAHTDTEIEMIIVGNRKKNKIPIIVQVASDIVTTFIMTHSLFCLFRLRLL